MTDKERLEAECDKTMDEVAKIADRIAEITDGERVPVVCAALAVSLAVMIKEYKHPDVELAKHLDDFVVKTATGASVGAVKHAARKAARNN